MYKIYADKTLIYDSTLEDYEIGKGEVTLELDNAGSFVFSLYPDHPHYDRFVKLRTVVTVYKSGRIIFRGRILDEAVDYWNTKTFTCEGELNFLQDSIARPFNFSGTPAQLFQQFIQLHNAQVDNFKRFKVGTITVEDPNGYIARENSGYESVLSNMRSRLLEDATGGHFCITHGDDGTDPVPTIHYLADFTKVASQPIEFGANLRDYAKTITAEEIATAIIPLGASVDDGNDETEDPKLTIAAVNGGSDYVYSAVGVAQYGWITKVVEWDDVTDAANLKAKAEKYLEGVINQAITLELTAVDLHLLDRSIESYNVCEYVPVLSVPHKFDDVLLCNKQTLNLLNPEADTVTMGKTFTSFTEMSARNASSINHIQKWSGRLNRALETAQQTNAELVEVVTRLDALYATGYITITVTVTGATEELLGSSGILTVNGQRIAADSTKIAVAAGDISVVFTLAEDLEAAQTITANEVDLGTVSTAGQSISATLTDVTDGGTVGIVFTAEKIEEEETA